MKNVTINPEGMSLDQRILAQSIGLVHNTKHWSVRKKLYKTSKGLFAVRCAKTIIVRLVK